MSSKYTEHTSDMRVTTTDGPIALDFNESGVMVVLPCDKQFIPWAEWEHIARVYGKRHQAPR